ncbi:hypothetical protein PHYSODRAFT_525552, partial [Phytophthora sojae]
YATTTFQFGQRISGGTRATKIGSDSAPAGYLLGRFLGTSGVELDSVAAVWTSINKVD